MARARKGKVEVEDVVEEEVEDDEDLEDLDDLEALADSEDETEEDEDEEDDDEDTPKAKKKKATTKKKSSGSIGTAELAEALGTDGKNLRVMLRAKKANRPRKKGGSFNESGRYEWKSIDEALELLGFDDLDEAQEALKESRNERLEALKERVGANKKSKASSDEDEDDEDEEDEPAPAPRRKKKTTAK